MGVPYITTGEMDLTERISTGGSSKGVNEVQKGLYSRRATLPEKTENDCMKGLCK